jgi:hypothetical protein
VGSAMEYTSPPRKLVRFFQRSRDAWKEKCQEARRECKRLRNSARAADKSRLHWKKLAQERLREIQELESPW